MTTATLFGIALAPLYAAIAQVESGRGLYSANVYQIDEDGHGYIDDVNKILKRNCLHFGLAFRPFPPQAKLDRNASERMMYLYWQHWGIHYQKKTGNQVTMEVLARIHNGGPIGWKKQTTVGYWHRVASVLETQGESSVALWSDMAQGVKR